MTFREALRHKGWKEFQDTETFFHWSMVELDRLLPENSGKSNEWLEASATINGDTIIDIDGDIYVEFIPRRL